MSLSEKTGGGGGEFILKGCMLSEQEWSVAWWWKKLNTPDTVLESAEKKIKRMQDQISEDIRTRSALV